MAEVLRTLLPRLSGDPKVSKVMTYPREPTGGIFPDLMADTRQNYLAIEKTGEGFTTYVKAVAGPYTGLDGNHFLIIPDRDDHGDIPGVNDLPAPVLAQTLQIVESVAYYTLAHPGITEVDFGYHHSRAEDASPPRKQKIASFPKHLNIHVTGYSESDMQPLTRKQIASSPELTGKTGEAIHKLGEEMLFHEIISPMRESNSEFDSLLGEVTDHRGRKRLKLLKGSDTFAGTAFAEILQTIDIRAKEKYDQIAVCFYESDAVGQYRINENGRFILLPREERKKNIEAYVSSRPWLSSGVREGLRLLGSLAKDEQTVRTRELQLAAVKSGAELSEDEIARVEKNTADRFLAFKDLAYTVVFSAIKGEGTQSEVDWFLAIEPRTFSVESLPQASSYTDKLIVRNNDNPLTTIQLSAVKAREQQIMIKVKMERRSLALGPGFIDTTPYTSD